MLVADRKSSGAGRRSWLVAGQSERETCTSSISDKSRGGRFVPDLEPRVFHQVFPAINVRSPSDRSFSTADSSRRRLRRHAGAFLLLLLLLEVTASWPTPTLTTLFLELHFASLVFTIGSSASSSSIIPLEQKLESFEDTTTIEWGFFKVFLAYWQEKVE